MNSCGCCELHKVERAEAVKENRRDHQHGAGHEGGAGEFPALPEIKFAIAEKPSQPGGNEIDGGQEDPIEEAPYERGAQGEPEDGWFPGAPPWFNGVAVKAEVPFGRIGPG